MKKRGFTLAEVMVALGLIGVIAALTIPTFVANSKNRANAAKLATTVSAVENAFTSMIATEAVNDLTETDFASARTEANLGRYLKLQGSNTTLTSYYGTATPFLTLSKASFQPLVTRIFQAKSGALLIYRDSVIPVPEDDSHPGSIGDMYIDVNGPAKPNVWGRDVFAFRVGNDGLLYPAGGEKFALMETAGVITPCNTISSYFCTARLIENNYEVDY